MSNGTALVYGSGAREHAIVDTLVRGGTKVFCYPGNGGIAQIAEIPKLTSPLSSPEDYVALAKHLQVDLTIVGPEALLEQGIADHFKKADLLLIGPTRNAALLETSKVWAKDFMRDNGIPTAKYNTCYSAEAVLLATKIRNWNCVIKADGLCGGKGVYVCSTEEEVRKAITQLMVDRIYGFASDRVVVEDKLEGIETSFFVQVDGRNFVEFGTAGDHKRAFDGDLGPNTGGTGAFSPCPFTTAYLRNRINEIVARTIAGMSEDGFPFQGFLYVGIMLTKDGPKVLEFNVRLGDPEAQVILPRLKTPLFDVFLAAATGKLDQMKLSWSDDKAVGVVLMSSKYPEKEKIHNLISGTILSTPQSSKVRIYHAATIAENDMLYATGGRIETVVGIEPSFELAADRAYKTIDTIHFDGMRFRRDIGKRAIEAERAV